MSEKQINIQFHKTKYAEFILGSYDNKLCLLDYKYRKMRQALDNKIRKMLNAEFTEKEDEILCKTKTQINEYFMGERTTFDIPLLMVGTEFEKDVWRSLLKVPYGQTATYSDLVSNSNNINTLKSISKANGSNSIALIVPCHRIIDDNGDLVGYGGGLPLKLKLLNLEQNLFVF
jgi:methylated-DNA-[protein]-cysteine S-methyltransferase